MKRKIFATAAFLISLSFSFFARGQEPDRTRLIFFYSASCHDCRKVKEELLPSVEKSFQEKIKFEHRDIADIENYKLFLSLKRQFSVEEDLKVPVVFFEGQFLSGFKDISDDLEKVLVSFSGGQIKKSQCDTGFDLLEHFNSFTPVTVISAGLIDGINPCAFTVIVFFISFLSLQGYRRRELASIGLCFIFAVFLTYLVLGFGLFSLFYCLKGFWIVRKLFNVIIGLGSIALGIFALQDLFRYRKTGALEGQVLSLPSAVKNRIHSVIGIHYRKDAKTNDVPFKGAFMRLVLAAFVTGFLVSILEAACTGQVYLPTITFVLKSTAIKAEAFGYLVLYNLMFIIPLLGIFVFALLGVSSQQFSKFLASHFALTRVLMALLFFALGILIVWRG